MAGVITVKCTVMKDGQKQLGMINGKSPIFIPGPVQPQFGPGRMLYFEVAPLFVLAFWREKR
jgi:formamidase